MQYFDTHAHLDSFIAENSVEGVLNSARSAGLCGVVAASNSPRDWLAYEKLSAQHSGFLHWGIGIHPEEVDENSQLALDALTSFFSSETPPVMVGEIGLDFHYLPEDKTAAAEIVKNQSAIFKRQLLLAADMGVPVCIHARNAVEEATAALIETDFPPQLAVFHCYAGSVAQLKRLNDMGARASFTGIITYKSAQEMRECLKAQSIEKTMFETDSPYLAPVPNRGKTNYPHYVADTVAAAAKILGMDEAALAEISTSNAKSFFNIK